MPAFDQEAWAGELGSQSAKTGSTDGMYSAEAENSSANSCWSAICGKRSIREINSAVTGLATLWK